MAHPFRIREIAVQAGLSEATVDRVIHNRSGVRQSTRDEVQRAVADLQGQRSQVRLGGRTFVVDVVVQAPERFTSEVQAALEAELPALQPAIVRCRFHFRQAARASELAATLEGIARRGSHGVILKAPDVPEITAATLSLTERQVPVVTLVTDLPNTQRVAYVGMDNRAAGATAAYLLTQWLAASPGDVLVSLSSNAFRGEEEREMGFRAAMRTMAPQRRLVDITESLGLDHLQRDLVLAALTEHPEVNAVYSIGGGNVATLAAFDSLRRPCQVFIAHDLDEDNRPLLLTGRISAVLHHDLNQDLRTACRLVMQANRALPGPALAAPSSIQVITPHNVPLRSSAPAQLLAATRSRMKRAP